MKRDWIKINTDKDLPSLTVSGECFRLLGVVNYKTTNSVEPIFYANKTWHYLRDKKPLAKGFTVTYYAFYPFIPKELMK